MNDVVLDQKAEEYAEKLIRHKMANHDIFVKEKAKEEIVNVYIAGYNEAKKGFQAEIEYAEKHCLFTDCTQNENLKKAKVLLKQFLEARNEADRYKAEWEAEQFLKE